ncbi:MAG: flagellar cap protein FliD N-terminal domain-containing protein, partial [Bacillota bacterium]|nr:flagellar cap protein FliD N-terminal domain-containing protein [Bacillota bacterium]
MAINSVSSSSGNKLRLSGLATGLDTDSIISGLMKVDKIPLDKVKQSKQLAEWKRDSYRDVTNILRGFKDEFFDVLKPSSYMMSQTSLKKFSSTSSDSTVVTATGGADASMGDHKITVTNLATAATVISSDNVTKDLQSISAISSDDIVNSSGKKIAITLDGVSKEITLGDYTNTTTLSDFASDIQDKIGLQFGQGKVKVDVSGVANNQLTFSTSGGATKLTLSSGSTNDGLANLYFDSGSSNRINLGDSLSSLKTKLKSSFNFATDSDGNQNVVLNINSKKFTFSSTTSLSTVLSTISNDSDSDVKIAYDDINDKFSITSKDTGAG